LRLPNAFGRLDRVARRGGPVTCRTVHGEDDRRRLRELPDCPCVLCSARILQLTSDPVALRDEVLGRHREQPLPFRRQCYRRMRRGHDGNWTRMGRGEISNTEIADRLSLFAALLELAE